MKLPNLRLSETQAFLALVLGLLALLSVPVMAVLVLKNFDLDHQTIPYNPESRFGSVRGALGYLGTALASLTCLAAGLLGFSSLGHKRNNKPMYSWSGMLLGAVSLSLILILFFTWFRLNEPMIQKL